MEFIENDDYGVESCHSSSASEQSSTPCDSDTELHEVDLERDGLDLLTGYACSISTVSNEDAVGEEDIWDEEIVQENLETALLSHSNISLNSNIAPSEEDINVTWFPSNSCVLLDDHVQEYIEEGPAQNRPVDVAGTPSAQPQDDNAETLPSGDQDVGGYHPDITATTDTNSVLDERTGDISSEWHLDEDFLTQRKLGQVARAAATERYIRDLDDAAKNRPDIEELPQRQYLKILMAGESGLGKTTFVRNLFQDYHPEVTVHDGTATSKETFLNAPEELCTKVEVEAKSGHTYCYSVQDTPGYGDDLELKQYVDMIVSFVKRQKEAFLKMDVDPQRSRDLADVEDPRVDICLYFIPSHRLKTVDVLFMKALSKEVALIPILAKADSMTTEEIQQFRTEVMASLEDEEVFHFSSEILTEAGSSPAHAVPPFAVVASNHIAPTAPDRRCRFWPVREYNWGTCEVKRTDHSDFAVLRRLLFELGYHAIRKETARRYYAYRSTELDWEASKRKDMKQQQLKASLQKQAWQLAAWQGAKALLALVVLTLVVASCSFRALQFTCASVHHIELENQELKRQVRALENLHDHDEGKLKEMEWQLRATDAELGNALSELHMARLLLNESNSNAEALAAQLWAAAEQQRRECDINTEKMENANYKVEYTNTMLKATERKMADLEQEIHQCRLEAPTCNCSKDKQTIEDLEDSEHMLKHLQEKMGKCENRVKKDEELMEAMQYRYTECYKKKRWQTIHLPFGDYFGG